MDYEINRAKLQTAITETIETWLKTVDMKSWESARQIDIVLRRTLNRIRSMEAKHDSR